MSDLFLIGAGRDHKTLELRRKALHPRRTFYIGALHISPGLKFPVNVEFCKKNFAAIVAKINEGNLFVKYKHDTFVTPMELEALCFGSEATKAAYEKIATTIPKTKEELEPRIQGGAVLDAWYFYIVTTSEEDRIAVVNGLEALGLRCHGGSDIVIISLESVERAIELFGLVKPGLEERKDEPGVVAVPESESEEVKASKAAQEAALRTPADEETPDDPGTEDAPTELEDAPVDTTEESIELGEPGTPVLEDRTLPEGWEKSNKAALMELCQARGIDVSDLPSNKKLAERLVAWQQG